MIWNILLFVLGLGLIIKGGDFFVDSAVWIAKAFRIPTFIIGATIVSIATTMPELLVSSIAAAEGQTEMAVGNAIGSVIANTALIMAIAMVAMPIVFKRKKYFKQCIMLVASSVVLLIGSLLGKNEEGYSLHFIASIALILILIYFMFENVRQAKKSPELPEVNAENADEQTNSEKKEPLDKKKFAWKIVLFIVGAAGIVGGSRLMVDNGQAIAVALGVPQRIIAVTLVAVGTSLPELVTTITAIIKKEAALSIGNVIGANIIDLTLILPFCSLISGKQLPVSLDSVCFDLPVFLGVCLVAVIPLMIKEKSSKAQGFVLLGIYAGYLGYMIYTILA